MLQTVHPYSYKNCFGGLIICHIPRFSTLTNECRVVGSSAQMQQPSKKISSSDESSPSPSVYPSTLKILSKTNNDYRRKRKNQQVDDNDLIVQILARLDSSSYLFALQEDAKTITENNIIPKYFPWNQKTVVEEGGERANHHKITKTIPKDIDELHIITHQDELHASFGDVFGPCVLGVMEMDNRKKTSSSTM